MHAYDRREGTQQQQSAQTGLNTFGFVPASQLRFDDLDANQGAREPSTAIDADNDQEASR